MGRGICDIDLRHHRKAPVGGHERRSAQRYEDRLETPVKQQQRDEVAAWFIRHHEPGKRMRVLSLPDEHWTFENQMNGRPYTSFVGLQRDWKTLERSVSWMPNSQSFPPWSEENRPRRVSAMTSAGELSGYVKGGRSGNCIFYIWAGHMLSREVIGPRKSGSEFHDKGRHRKVTAAWLDFTGYLNEEVVAAACGIPALLDGSRRGPFPVVFSFLACRDNFSSHEARVASLLISLQERQPERGLKFRFDRFTLHAGTSPFISVFGSFLHSRYKATAAEHILEVAR